jgi:hypothetical protein
MLHAVVLSVLLAVSVSLTGCSQGFRRSALDYQFYERPGAICEQDLALSVDHPVPLVAKSFPGSVYIDFVGTYMTGDPEVANADWRSLSGSQLEERNRKIFRHIRDVNLLLSRTPVTLTLESGEQVTLTPLPMELWWARPRELREVVMRSVPMGSIPGPALIWIKYDAQKIVYVTEQAYAADRRFTGRLRVDLTDTITGEIPFKRGEIR